MLQNPEVICRTHTQLVCGKITFPFMTRLMYPTSKSPQCQSEACLITHWHGQLESIPLYFFYIACILSYYGISSLGSYNSSLSIPHKRGGENIHLYKENSTRNVQQSKKIVFFTITWLGSQSGGLGILWKVLGTPKRISLLLPLTLKSLKITIKADLFTVPL